MEIREVLALNLRKLRRANGLSQEELAHRAKIDRTHISALERSVYAAGIDVVDRLTRVLGLRRRISSRGHRRPMIKREAEVNLAHNRREDVRSRAVPFASHGAGPARHGRRLSAADPENRIGTKSQRST